MYGFHSINFPSEWGEAEVLAAILAAREVSIQLISPASGEYQPEEVIKALSELVSIQLISPASGEPDSVVDKWRNAKAFPFN